TFDDLVRAPEPLGKPLTRDLFKSIEFFVAPAKALRHAHTSKFEPICSNRYEYLARTEERSRRGDRAFFDFAQNEDEFYMPSTVYLILSEVEGRTAPMQMLQDVCIHAYLGCTGRRGWPGRARP